MAKRKVERVHLILGPTTRIDLDDYQAIAGVRSRSETIRYLACLALRDELPPGHQQIVHLMKEKQYSRSPQAFADLLAKHQGKAKKRIHITLNSEDRRDIEAYRASAGIGTRAEAIRRLFGLALSGGSLPPDHLEVVRKLAIEAPIRILAHRFWEEEGCPRKGKDKDHWARAVEELARRQAEDGKVEPDVIAATEAEASRPRRSIQPHEAGHVGETSDAVDDTTTYTSYYERQRQQHLVPR